MPAVPVNDEKLALLQDDIAAVDQIVQAAPLYIGQFIGTVNLSAEVEVAVAFLIKAGIDLSDLEQGSWEKGSTLPRPAMAAVFKICICTAKAPPLFSIFA